MPKPKAQEPREHQLLIRLTARQQAVLESVAHLERATPNQYAHQVLVDHLANMTSNPRVLADLENRAAYARDLAATTALDRRHHDDEASVADRGVAGPTGAA